MDIIKFFIKKTIFVNLIAIFATLTGFYIFFSSPKEIFPQIDFGIIVINTFYPQAASAEVEKLITVPIEDAIKGIKGIKRITSSSSEGLSMVVVESEAGYDIKTLKDDIKSAVSDIKDFPEEADDPDVFDISSDEISILLASVSGGTYAERRKTTRILIDKISEIDGIGTIDKWGYVDKAIWVEAKKALLDKYKLTIFDIMNVLEDRNISSPAGNKRLNGMEYSIRFLSEQKTADEIKKVIVRSNEAGKSIRIKDISDVKDGFEEQESFSRANGKDSILLVFRKKKGYDAIKLVKEIKDICKKYEHSVSKNVNVSFSDDFSIRLKDRLNVLYSNGIFGGILVLLLLIMFLRPSLAVVTAMGLPVALGGAFLITNSMGITFNMISLFGFIMVVGMLVDDAIVVSENTYRYIEKGKNPEDAALIGTKEMILPVLGSVLTTIAAFLPLLLVGGMMGKFMGVVPKVVSIALLTSLFECFFILPSHIRDFVKEKKISDIEKKQEHWFEVLKEKYINLLNKVLHNRGIFITGIVILFVISIFLIFKMGVVFSNTQINEIEIKIEAPKTFGLDDTKKIVESMEKKLLTISKKDLKDVFSYVGYQENRRGAPKLSPNIAHIRVILQLEDKRKTKDANKLVGKIRKLIGHPENVEKISINIVKAGPSQGMADISYTITGDTFKKIEKVSEVLKEKIKNITIKKRGREIKPVREVYTDHEEGKKEIRFIVDEKKATLVGVSQSQVSLILRAAIAGLNVKTIKREGEDVDIIVRINENDINSLSDILSLKVPNKYGKLIPLKSFVNTEYGYGYSILKHRDGKKSITVYGTVDKQKAKVSRVNVAILKIINKLKKEYPDINFITGGEFKELIDSLKDLAKAFIVAFMLIFIILATLFNSLTQPFIIMLAIPFGFIGVILSLFFHGQPASFMSLMGFVGLSGVVVNDSLIMVSFINQLLKEKENKEEAIIEGASTRLRPIILTTVTTSFGLFPLAYGWFGGSDPFLQPMALAFAWGLIFASLVTLFIIPAFLVSLYNLKVIIKNLVLKTDEKRIFSK